METTQITNFYMNPEKFKEIADIEMKKLEHEYKLVWFLLQNLR